MEPKLEEIRNRLDSIESELMQKINELEAAGGKTWVQRNLSTVISTAVILIGFAVAWGRIEMRIESLQASDQRVQMEIDLEAQAVRNHHEDTGKHVDQSWKSEMRSDLNSIRQLLIEHMADGKPKR